MNLTISQSANNLRITSVRNVANHVYGLFIGYAGQVVAEYMETSAGMDFIAGSQPGTETILQLNILVVDDDVLNQRMMQLLLKREGHQVDLASNGLEALEAVKQKKYDIVFMDLQMPVMDGIEASRQIRKWENGGQHTFIVALTASYFPEKGHVLFEAGMDNYISKPFEMEHIQRLLKYSFKARLTEDSAATVMIEQELPVPKVLDTRRGVVQVGGDEGVYRELLHDFVEQLPRRLERIQGYLADMNLAELSRAAHNLSGITGSLGALQLSEYAKKLDKQSLEGYTESLENLLQEIQLAVGALIETSNSFLAEKKIIVESA